MPLNPPSCQMDVYRSPNVFANYVPVALWRPPAGSFNNGKPSSANVGGTEIYNANEAGEQAQLRKLSSVQQGNPDYDDDNGGDVGSGAIPSPNGNTNAPAAISKGNSKYLQYSDLPNDQKYPDVATHPIYKNQISKYFTLAYIKRAPETYPGKPMAKDIAWNFVLLAQNVLDPLKERFNFSINSGYRSPWYNEQIGGAKNSEHMYGIAADCDPGNSKQCYEMFNYIINSNIPFRNVIFEGGWIHVSFQNGSRGNTPLQVMPYNRGSLMRKNSLSKKDQALAYAREYA